MKRKSTAKSTSKSTPRTKSGKQAKVHKVMHEFKAGELKGGKGARGKVKSRKQAIAIALHESGQSWDQHASH